jgi:hypothetical protein
LLDELLAMSPKLHIATCDMLLRRLICERNILVQPRRSWLQSTDAAAIHKPTGRALKCGACDGKLLLNALALQQHVASKRHLRNVKGADTAQLAVIGTLHAVVLYQLVRRTVCCG